MIRKYLLDQTNRNFSIATIWISGGSDKDIPGKKGLNQLLCSLLIRGCEGFDDLSLSDYIESHGAELNHAIFEDGIWISIKSLNNHFNKLFPLIELIVDKPILSEIEFQKIKQSTINALKKDKENPFNITYEKWRKIVYSSHPYAFNSSGYEKDILRIEYNDVLDEYKKFKERKKYLISNNPKIKGPYEDPLEKIFFNDELKFPLLNNTFKERIVISQNDSNQTIIMLGNQTCSCQSNEYWHLKVLESYLSFGMSSVLFKLFREKNGITYDVGVFNPMRKRNAPFLVYLSVSNKNALSAFGFLSKLWRKLLFSCISEDEVTLAKEKLKASFLLSNQSLDEIIQRRMQLISYEVRPLTYEEYISKIEGISSGDLKVIFRKYFARAFLSITGNKEICSQIENEWTKGIVS